MVEVHGGNINMNWMIQEQEHGITITSTVSSTSWKTDLFVDVRFNLIDTSDHINFTTEIEKDLRILDGIVIILDGSVKC
ncbi:GTP-binding protein [Candidatus Hodgkinia cicadicola]|uniref:GTP-binding protein n=1 Tax=Candidatus Hodgkinia cicadicola TaxID=573658 RepID=UPI002415792B